jgi:hypothetical protein
LLKTMHPVALPPGLLMTKPAVIGSPPVLNTIGISDVAAFAAYAEASPPVATSTLTWRPTPPIRGQPPRTRKSLLARKCVVGSGGLEPPTKRLCASGLPLPGRSGLILESQ